MKTPGGRVAVPDLREGLGDMVDRLVAELTLRGADLRTRVTVSALEDHPDRTHVVFENGSVTADAVVLATGPAGAARLLAGPVPRAAAALEAIPLASTTVVTLAYANTAFAAPVTSHEWLEAVPAPVSGVTISSAKWEGRAPGDEVLIRAFVPDRVGSLARAGDDEILSAVRSHVESALAATSGPAASWISRWRGVMPKYTVGHLGRVTTVEEALEATRGECRLRVAWRGSSRLHR